MLSCFSYVQLFATLWTVVHQAPLFMGFSRRRRRFLFLMGKPLASPSLGESRRADEHKGQQPDSAPGSCFKPDTEVGATWTAILPLCPGSCPKMEPPGVGSDCPALLQGPHCCCRGCVSTLPCGFWISRPQSFVRTLAIN